MAISKILIRVPEAPERRVAARMTGRYLMTMQPSAHQEISAKLNRAGFKTATPLPRLAMAAKPLPDGTQLGLKNIGVSLVAPTPQQEDSLHRMAEREGAVIGLEPERIVRAVDSNDYIRGWRDAVDALAGRLLEVPRPPAAVPAEVPTAAATWGLVATKVVGSPL